jgi:Co/Zn/Cd efflux system component
MAQVTGGGGRQRDEPSDTDSIPGQLCPRPFSNEKLLCTAFVSFQCFAVVQTFAAFMAGSEAMMGDAAAMMVDAFTYLFNWLAERQKVFYASKLSQRGHSKVHVLECRKGTYQLELVPPLLSISTLLVVTGFILNKSIRILVLDSKRDVSEQADPNINLMIIFSFLNLLLDVVNVFCFAVSKHPFGYKTTDVGADSSQGNDTIDALPPFRSKGEVHFDDEEEDKLNSMQSFSFDGGRIPEDDEGHDSNGLAFAEASIMKPFEMEGPTGDHQASYFHGDGEDGGSNLNMCSAYTVRA